MGIPTDHDYHPPPPHWCGDDFGSLTCQLLPLIRKRWCYHGARGHHCDLKAVKPRHFPVMRSLHSPAPALGPMKPLTQLLGVTVVRYTWMVTNGTRKNSWRSTSRDLSNISRDGERRYHWYMNWYMNWYLWYLISSFFILFPLFFSFFRCSSSCFASLFPFVFLVLAFFL